LGITVADDGENIEDCQSLLDNSIRNAANASPGLEDVSKEKFQLGVKIIRKKRKIDNHIKDKMIG